MLRKLSRNFHTLRYMRQKQIWYRLYYLLRYAGKRKYSLSIVPGSKNSQHLKFTKPLGYRNSYLGDNTFNFLNLEHTFEDQIDWNFSRHGKLWTYNLNYFEFLGQQTITVDAGLELMLDFAQQYETITEGLEQYPTSLRIMNWIKFVSVHQIENEIVEQVIYSDILRIRKMPEYHLLANHLLENGFALFFGACYFRDPQMLKKSERILIPELKEQILNDGAHFELSPMYHQIILSRILDCINILHNNPATDSGILPALFRENASKMLGWLLNMTFSNGDVPHVNDSTNDIAPATETIKQYAGSLDIDPQQTPLNDSGYRKINQDDYELVLDVGNIGPDYNPGHAHSDTLNFVLYYKSQPLIVDTGISTYEKNQLRNSQRSTAAHNTVRILNKEQSEVWDGFKVAKRAKCSIEKETQNSIVASHDGYKGLGITHKRSFTYTPESIIIADTLNQASTAKAFLHFHPRISIDIVGNQINGAFGSIYIGGSGSVKTGEYQYALGYNQTKTATMVIIEFTQNLETTIQFA